ncbi:hypothetical protein [Streptomyces mirabilis]|uniref:hypothetical protein n=1 Tax=Streptomyces mirabilis TaxID=68239 RepID=UPI0036690807
MRRAYAHCSEGGQGDHRGVVLGLQETCDSWRTSEREAQRADMAPYVVEEREGFCRGRELTIPQR